MTNELYWRVGCFLSILIIMMLLEWKKPARLSPITARYRWFGNFSLVIVSSIIARLVVPVSLTTLADFNHQQALGLFNYLELSLWVSIPLSLLILDMLIYWQHRLFHQVPLLWRLHKVHHADCHVDASTGLRFHPIEIALSILFKLIAITVLGVPAVAVLIFEVALNGFALFNHANICLSEKLEKALRLFIITQKLHRIHHSTHIHETNSNYGFSLVWWDKLFLSYRNVAIKGDDLQDIGLSQYKATKQNTSLATLLSMPFK
ncbi:sterol desaturase family protein (plasmid) [Pseudoalteromonas sp. CF6-2]|uniref:sterol desaturase family protein n=1 Tax=Pseudoalteromonas sp. CF6-2 TaxID=562716 RepID=UPI001F1EB394|nr:sterol desaturase family protein [Pseudoalteromonas sp. CF6-2]